MTAVRTKQTSESAVLTLSDRYVGILGTLRFLRDWSIDGKDRQRTNKAPATRSGRCLRKTKIKKAHPVTMYRANPEVV